MKIGDKVKVTQYGHRLEGKIGEITELRTGDIIFPWRVAVDNEGDDVFTEGCLEVIVGSYPKPKFPIGSFIVYEEDYVKVIDSEYKHGSLRYYVGRGTWAQSKEDCVIADESELTAV